MGKLKLAVQLYSVREAIAEDMPGTLKKVAEIGYKGVEFFGGFRWSAEEVKKAADEAGVEIVGWHIGHTSVEPDNIYTTIAYLKAIGAKTVTIPWIPEEMRSDTDAWRKTIKFFNEANKTLMANGIRLGYHNHNEEFSPVDGDKTAWDLVMTETCDCFNGQLDNGNAMSGSADPVALIKKYANKAYNWHIKPYSKESGFKTMIGKDSIDWKETFETVINSGVTEWSIVEYEEASMYSELDGVKACYDVIKSLGY